MKKPLVFSDLDDTIFQTARKMKSPPLTGQKPVSVASNGSHSYMTAPQSLIFEWLNKTTRFIPVTARSTTALQRCTLAFRDYQVAANGAVILLPNGKIDQTWIKQTKIISEQMSGLLLHLYEKVEADNADQKLRHWIVHEVGMPIYYCVKSNNYADHGADRLEDLQSILTDLTAGQMLMHCNGNNLSFTPHKISKRRAVDYLIAKIGDANTPIWGLGDSVTDVPFMELCDMLVIPRDSQVHKTFTKV